MAEHNAQPLHAQTQSPSREGHVRAREQETAERPRIALRAAPFLVQVLLEDAAVVQAGESVGAR